MLLKELYSLSLIDKKDCIEIDTSYDFDKLIRTARQKNRFIVIDREKIRDAKMLCYEIQQYVIAYAKDLLGRFDCDQEITIEKLDYLKNKFKSCSTTLKNTQEIYERVCRLKYLRADCDVNYLNCMKSRSYVKLFYDDKLPFTISEYESFSLYETY